MPLKSVCRDYLCTELLGCKYGVCNVLVLATFGWLLNCHFKWKNFKPLKISEFLVALVIITLIFERWRTGELRFGFK